MIEDLFYTFKKMGIITIIICYFYYNYHLLLPISVKFILFIKENKLTNYSMILCYTTKKVSY